jgi:hypothetical protein
MARRVAASVAGDEARKSGKSYVVAMTLKPRAIYVLAADDPQLAALAIEVMFEKTSAGECIRREKSTRH